MKIPCETIVRMSHMLPSPNVEIDPIFRTLRLDNGKIIATDRRFMAIEQIADPFTGVFHIALPDAVLDQCRTEAQWGGYLEVIPTPEMQFTTGKTMYGYVVQGNIGVYPPGVTDFDRWADPVRQCSEPAAASSGGMVWLLDDIQRLVACSPSGVVIFEQNIDCNRVTVVRDVNSYEWCGFFLPRMHQAGHFAAATLPGWLR